MPVLRLFCALVDPGADDAYFFGGEFGIFFDVFRRGHEIVFVAEVGDVGDEEAFGAFAGLEDFAVDAAFERAGESVEAQFAFRFFRSVALDTGFIEKGFNVLVEGEAWFGGGRGQFAGIDVDGARDE